MDRRIENKNIYRIHKKKYKVKAKILIKSCMFVKCNTKKTFSFILTQITSLLNVLCSSAAESELCVVRGLRIKRAGEKWYHEINLLKVNIHDLSHPDILFAPDS